MKTLFLLLPLQCLLLFAAIGQKTTIEKSWRDPGTLMKMGQFNKILVVALVRNEQNRKKVEDEIIKQLKSKAVASYTLRERFPDGLTESIVADLVKKEGFDGAIIMQLMNPANEIKYSPGTGTYPANYQSFYPYYEGASAKYEDEAYFDKNEMYVIETNIYTLKENKLIWNGITNTVEPQNIDRFITSLAKTITNEMKRQGFLY
jgi:hypothetical protein